MNQAQINKLGDRIKRAFNITAGESIALAVRIDTAINGEDRVKSRESLLMSWRKDDAKRLADHFWWLAKTYERNNETGRAITFKRAASVIYSAIEADQGFGFKDFIAHAHIGYKVRLEAYEFWLANGQFTSRQNKLINRGGIDPAYPAQAPQWQG